MSYNKYLANYPMQIKEQVTKLIESGNLKTYLLNKYPTPHNYNSDKALYNYATELKQQYLKHTPIISKVLYTKQKDMVINALGTHSFVSRNHGGKLKSKHEIRIASTLKYAPEPLLKMLVVHELAHFKEKDHNKNFYKLCEYMEPDYHQLELDLRIYLIFIELGYTLF